jgi:hypothetical protein
VPDSYPEFNTGVFFYRKSIINTLVDKWYKSHKDLLESKKIHDQPSLRKVLFESNFQISTLTPEYNLRVRGPSYVHGRVKVLHGHCSHALFEYVGKIVNESMNRRVFYWEGNKLITKVKDNA